MNQDLLSTIAEQLSSGGLNYQVFLRVYTAPVITGGNANTYIHSALGNEAVVDSIKPATDLEVLEEIESAISYRGTAGAGPTPTIFESPKFTDLLKELRSDLSAILADVKIIMHFRLSEGHPAYPVFWDFAYLFVLHDKAIVLIGSSSD